MSNVPQPPSDQDPRLPAGHGSAPRQSMPLAPQRDPNEDWNHTTPRYHRAVTVGAVLGGGVVILAALFFGTFLVLGSMNGSKVASAQDFREKMQQFGREHGMSHCADAAEILGSSSSSSSSDSGFEQYVCADRDLTQQSLRSSELPRVVVGSYSKEYSVPETQLDLDSEGSRLAWTLVGEHWMLQTTDDSAGSMDDAQDLFGGHEPKGSN